MGLYDIDRTAHDAAYQAQLDREGLREAWVDNRAQEIAHTLLSARADSGLDECLQEMMSPDLATLIREVAEADPVRIQWRAATLSRRLHEVVEEYARAVAENEADAIERGIA